METNLVLNMGAEFQIILRHQLPIDRWSYLIKVEKAVTIKGIEYQLGIEVLDTVLLDIQNACLNIINGKADLDSFFENIGIGLYYNIYTFNIYLGSFYNVLPFLDEDISIRYHFLEGNNYMLLFYSKGKAPYVEIVPLYPRFEDPNLKDFKEWIKNYRSIAVTSISLEKLNEINNKVNSFYKNLLNKR